MKRCGCLLMIFWLILGMLPAGAEEKITTTVMVYMCGSNLESQYGNASADILEMMDSGLDRFSTQVAVMTGGSSHWAIHDLQEEQMAIHQLRGNSLYPLWQGEARSMGDSETLSFFLNTVYNQFQTDRYVLIFWNHGGGPIHGVCWDENFEKDALQIPELIEGIENSPFRERKLDLIGFDACLMGSVETAFMLSEYAHLMIASEEKEPATGWNYAFLRGMEQEALSDTARRLIDLYIDTTPREEGTRLTLSCIDLAQMDHVVQEMNDYFASLSTRIDEQAFRALSNLRYSVQGFGRDYRAEQSNDYDLVDISGLLNAFQNYSTAPSDELLTALEDAVIYHRSTDEKCAGLSVYFPYFNQKSYLELGKERYIDLDFCKGYAGFIDTFQQRMNALSDVNWQHLTPVVARQGDGFQISLPLTAEQKKNLVSAKMVILDSDFAPGSQNAYYRAVYGTADVGISAESALSASYQDQRLIFHFETENGYMGQAAAIPFQILDSGEYLVQFLASNLEKEYGPFASHDAPGVSHLMQFTLSAPDEEGRLSILKTEAWDSTTNTFTPRTGDSLHNYQYLYFVSESGMITRQNGLILPFGEWETASDYHAGMKTVSYALADSQWSFSIEKAPDSIQYAAFEITDIYNHTFMTELVLLRPVEEMCLYRQRYSLPNPKIDIDCFLVANSTHRMTLEVQLTNHTQETFSFQLLPPMLNGKEVDLLANSASLSRWVMGPGESCSTYLRLGPQYGHIQELAISLALYQGADGPLLGSTGYLPLTPDVQMTDLTGIFK